MKKPGVGVTNQVAGPVEALGVMKGKVALWDHLTATTYEGGEPRRTSTVTLFVEEGLVKACLSDREEGRTLWMTGPSVDAVLASMEKALASERPDWRASRPNVKQPARRG